MFSLVILMCGSLHCSSYSPSIVFKDKRNCEAIDMMLENKIRTDIAAKGGDITYLGHTCFKWGKIS